MPSAGTARACWPTGAIRCRPTSTQRLLGAHRAARHARAGRLHHRPSRVLGPGLRRLARRARSPGPKPSSSSKPSASDGIAARTCARSSTSAPAAVAWRSRWRESSRMRRVLAHRHLRGGAGCRREQCDAASGRSQVTFVRGDLLDPVQGPVDVIVSNPPYVPSGVELSPDIVRFEPSVALYSGRDGLTLVNGCDRRRASRLAAERPLRRGIRFRSGRRGAGVRARGGLARRDHQRGPSRHPASGGDDEVASGFRFS